MGDKGFYHTCGNSDTPISIDLSGSNISMDDVLPISVHVEGQKYACSNSVNSRIEPLTKYELKESCEICQLAGTFWMERGFCYCHILEAASKFGKNYECSFDAAIIRFGTAFVDAYIRNVNLNLSSHRHYYSIVRSLYEAGSSAFHQLYLSWNEDVICSFNSRPLHSVSNAIVTRLLASGHPISDCLNLVKLDEFSCFAAFDIDSNLFTDMLEKLDNDVKIELRKTYFNSSASEEVPGLIIPEHLSYSKFINALIERNDSLFQQFILFMKDSSKTPVKTISSKRPSSLTNTNNWPSTKRRALDRIFEKTSERVESSDLDDEISNISADVSSSASFCSSDSI